ncbi:MAG TPA: PhzF family phenazine biosynthesis protein [Candidatus Dormibacteraeota bacterium]|nr:PhzF family phenazine biosynthesis protein [Candidatus Dormibacteraeota bacterium]
MTKGHRILTVDVFAEKPLAGNQLAVVLDAEDVPGDVMQRIAKEMNISETTFVMPPADPAHAARIRIFTPANELPFAGHPTVGTAWVLATEGLVPGGSLEFVLEEGIGPVKVRGVKGPNGLTFWMTHPELTFGAVERRRAQAAAAIGLTEADLLADVPVQVASTGNPFLFIALRDARAVDEAAPDLDQLSDVLKLTRAFGAFIFTAVGGNRLYSRMFSLDIPEDPATGSGSGPLGGFAVRYGLVPRAPKVAIVNEQGTNMGRQSFIYIELTYQESEDVPSRIEVGGSVRPVIVGTLSY